MSELMAMIEERDAWALIASVPGLGPSTFGRLLRDHGSALRVLELARAGPEHLAFPQSDPGDALDDTPPHRLRAAIAGRLAVVARDPRPFVERLRLDGLELVTLDDDVYPARLRALEEPPPVLFVRGSVAALAPPHAVAVVGTRRPTEAGRRVAGGIAAALGRVGVVVVSGLAVGIDGAAHAAVVAEGRPTVAVLGSGHGRLFPRAHARLATAIVAGGGAVISELAPDVEPTRGTFPRRNRVISGLAEATVVVEAAEGSGALITARWALEQGRGCFIVPGPIDAPASSGCNRFLRAYPGPARIVAGIPELIADLEIGADDPTDATVGGPSLRPVTLSALLATLGPTAGRVGAALAAGATTVDELAERTALPVATVLGALTILEMDGLVVSAYGRYRAAGALATSASGATGLP